MLIIPEDLESPKISTLQKVHLQVHEKIEGALNHWKLGLLSPMASRPLMVLPQLPSSYPPQGSGLEGWVLLKHAYLPFLWKQSLFYATQAVPTCFM